MNKKILSQLMILSFAFAGLFLVGNNVFADPTEDHYAEDEDGGGGSSQKTCYGRGVYGTLGYYYCDGLSLCYWVENADADTHTGAQKCTP